MFGMVRAIAVAHDTRCTGLDVRTPGGANTHKNHIMDSNNKTEFTVQVKSDATHSNIELNDTNKQKRCATR